MMEIKKVLFPVDLSAVSSKIAPSVIAFGEAFDAEIHLVHAAVTMEEISGLYGPDVLVGNFEEEVAQSAAKELEKFEQKHFAGYSKKKRVVLQGDPVEKIIAYIGAEKIDLVIMGTHGRKGLDKIMFGSVANRMVRRSPVPVRRINPYRKI